MLPRIFEDEPCRPLGAPLRAVARTWATEPEPAMRFVVPAAGAQCDESMVRDVYTFTKESLAAGLAIESRIENDVVLEMNAVERVIGVDLGAGDSVTAYWVGVRQAIDRRSGVGAPTDYVGRARHFLR